MISTLDVVVSLLPEMVKKPELWSSLIINRRKPITYRAFHLFTEGSLAGVRVCLHKFESCGAEDAFYHPHPWPSAMCVLLGSYRMRVGMSPNLEGEPITVMDSILSGGSKYSSEEPNFWHSVQPLETCYSIMINGAPWLEKAHKRAPTTTGKDLDTMTDEQLSAHLNAFSFLLEECAV